MQKPLAEILRPHSLDQYVGQEHLMGKGAVLRNAIEQRNIQSMIFWGPPGVGKTTLALLIAELVDADFFLLSAINSGVKDIRDVIEKAKKSEKKSLLFIDEIHRFSKSQQDSLLGAVEQGIITLIGATTENPSFEVISPLLSRCQVYVLKSLSRENLETILGTAVAYLSEQMSCKIEIEDTEALLRISGGDARKLLNAIELVAWMTKPVDGVIHVTHQQVVHVIQQNLALYDKKGEQHYDIISAFIKSMRGSDPNAAVYWMARMLIGGEDPLFIARRMVILASEDIGNANPNALLLANNCFQAVNVIGMPEARIPLAQTAIYLASSPKSNASYMAIERAYSLVKQTGDLPVPLHIRNAPTKLMKELGYHKNYQYAHDFEHNFVNQEFLPDAISGTPLYEPQNNPRENELRRYLKQCWKEKYHYVMLLLVALGFFFSLNRASAQNYHFSQYYTQPAAMNPALTGAYDGIIRAGLTQRTQWLSVTVPYLTFGASVDGAIYRNNRKQTLIGAGLSFNGDKAGDLNYTSLQAVGSVSLIRYIGRRNRHKLGLGFYGGIINNAYNQYAARMDEQYQHGYYDPTIPIHDLFDNTRQLFFDCGIGAFWSFSPNKTDNYQAGMSVSHLNQPKEVFQNGFLQLPLRWTTHALARISLSSNLALEPSLYMSWQRRFSEYTFGTNIEYFQKKNSYTTLFSLGGGIFYRWNDALILDGFFDWQNLRIGISYDVNVSRFFTATSGRGALEVSITYIFRKKRITRIGKEPCPYDLM
ncbi:MAG: PorP/SprF family type IX secretion system membrane protein [Bacteroidales bacterium]|nr:PorP/SprF family type IX secretion system membrane protein [Bacteroidales bacterium]